MVEKMKKMYNFIFVFILLWLSRLQVYICQTALVCMNNVFIINVCKCVTILVCLCRMMMCIRSCACVRLIRILYKCLVFYFHMIICGCFTWGSNNLGYTDCCCRYTYFTFFKYEISKRWWYNNVWLTCFFRC